MASRFPFFGWLALLAVAGVLTTAPKQTRAQTLNDGWSKLAEKFKAVRPRVLGFIKGDPVDPKDNSHVEAIDLLAKYYTYGVYLQKLDAKPDLIRRHFEEFERDMGIVLKAKNSPAMQPMAEVFSNRLGVHALEVIQFQNALPIHKLHNARVLAKTAELGQAPLADTILTVLKDPQQKNDGVAYCMLKGLAALLPQLQPPQQAKCAEVLVAFLEQKKGPDKKAAQDQIDGFRVLRRMAIRALAKTRAPAINDTVRPALVLARFAGNDSRIQPPPRIDERVEAAIGLARMQAAPNDNQYQVDYAAGQVAKCLGAMAQLAESERANKEARTYPWRILAAQLKDALETQKKSNAQNKYVVGIADKGAKLLDKVISGAQINPNEQTWFSSKQSDPPSKELFRGAADSTVTPAPQVEEPEK